MSGRVLYLKLQFLRNLNNSPMIADTETRTEIDFHLYLINSVLCTFMNNKRSNCCVPNLREKIAVKIFGLFGELDRFKYLTCMEVWGPSNEGCHVKKYLVSV